MRTRIQVDRPEGTAWLETLNLGLGGAYCHSKVPLPIGDTFLCRIQLRGVGHRNSVQVGAEVLRSEYRKDGFRIALRFTMMDKEIRETLQKFLAGKGVRERKGSKHRDGR